jgi:hypothetical protein
MPTARRWVISPAKWRMVARQSKRRNDVCAAPIPSGEGLELRDGVQIQLSRAAHGRLAVVQMIS